MYPSPNPVYGLQPTIAPEPVRSGFDWAQIPRDLVELGPAVLAGALGLFIGRAIMTPIGVPGWLAALVGAFGLGALILRLFRRMYAAA